MGKVQPKKLGYIGIGGIIVLLCVIVGIVAYRQWSQDTEKATTTTTPNTPSSPRKNKNKITPNPASSPTDGQDDITPTTDLSQIEDTHKAPNAIKPQPTVGHPVDFNPIFNAALVGVYWWIASYYNDEIDNNGSMLINTIATVGCVAAMLVYIGCFFYKDYKDIASFAKNLGIFAGVGTFTRICIFYFLMWLQSLQADGARDNFLTPILEIGIIYAGTWLFATVGIFVIKHSTSIPTTEKPIDIWLACAFILEHIWSKAAINKQSILGIKVKPVLLYTISSCFAYTQVLWTPKIATIGSKRIAYIINWSFQPFHLIRGVHYIVHYSSDQGDYPITRQSRVWIALQLASELFTQEPLHLLKIAKTSDTGDYTVSFPLDKAEVFENAFMGLLCGYGLANRFLSDSLSTAILCVASLVIIGLYLKLYFRIYKKSIPQWAEFGLDTALNIIGSMVAFYYLSNYDQDQVSKFLIGAGSLVIAALYIFPRWLNRLTKASNKYPTITKPLQGFTDFSLQSNPAVMHTVIAAGTVGTIYVAKYYSQSMLIKKFIRGYAATLGVYCIIKVVEYNVNVSEKQTTILDHVNFLIPFVATMQSTSGQSSFKNFHWIGWSGCYVLVAYVMHILNHLAHNYSSHAINNPISQWCLGRLARGKACYLAQSMLTPEEEKELSEYIGPTKSWRDSLRAIPKHVLFLLYKSFDMILLSILGLVIRLWGF